LYFCDFYVILLFVHLIEFFPIDFSCPSGFFFFLLSDTEKSTALANLSSQIERLEQDKAARLERKERRIAEATKELGTGEREREIGWFILHFFSFFHSLIWLLMCLDEMKANCTEQEQKVMKQLKEVHRI
jgi:hypothetical protein